MCFAFICRCPSIHHPGLLLSGLPSYCERANNEEEESKIPLLGIRAHNSEVVSGVAATHCHFHNSPVCILFATARSNPLCFGQSDTNKIVVATSVAICSSCPPENYPKMTRQTTLGLVCHYFLLHHEHLLFFKQPSVSS